MIIAIDFDGTCVYHDFPRVGKDIGAIPVLKKLVDNGHQLILFTMRSHNDRGNEQKRDVLQDAIDWFNKHDIPLYGVNENPSQYNWTSSPKPYANIYIDDVALGVPLKYDENRFYDRPYVDWERVENYLKQIGAI